MSGLPLKVARCLAAALGAAGLVGLYLEFYSELGLRGLVQYASYFTNLSNAGFVLVALGLAWLPGRVTSSTWFVAARGTVTISMVLTGLGYTALLRDTAGLFANPWINYVLHAILPLIALADWLVLPPGWPRLRFVASVWRWLVYPTVWVGYTFLHGWATGWYPYPFIDPNQSGGRDVAVVLGIMTGVLVAMVFLLVQYQRWRVTYSRDRPLSRTGSGRAPDPSRSRQDADAADTSSG